MFAEEGVVYFTMAWAAKRIPEAQATLMLFDSLFLFSISACIIACMRSQVGWSCCGSRMQLSHRSREKQDKADRQHESDHQLCACRYPDCGRGARRRTRHGPCGCWQAR